MLLWCVCRELDLDCVNVVCLQGAGPGLCYCGVFAGSWTWIVLMWCVCRELDLDVFTILHSGPITHASLDTEQHTKVRLTARCPQHLSIIIIIIIIIY